MRCQKPLFSDWGVTKELNTRLGIQLQQVTTYHPRTNGQSEITNKFAEQYLRHYVGYQQQGYRKELLPTAELAYNNNNHASTGTLPFQADYVFEPCFGGILSPKQCLMAVEDRLQYLAPVQE